MVVSFAAASRLATEFGTEFQTQLDQIEAIPPIGLDRNAKLWPLLVSLKTVVT